MRGFTLIEVIIYMALFSLMLTGMFSSAYALQYSAHTAVVRGEQLFASMHEEAVRDQGIHSLP